jgi:hypothetical protein
MGAYLSHLGVYLKDFGHYAEQLTAQVKGASLANAQQQQREIRYLCNTRARKEDIAREIASRDQITDGLICVLTAVELCRSFGVCKNAQRQRIELELRSRKCLHLYHYMIHPVFGFMHARLQSWLPFNVQVCINGREWLSRQLDKARIAYQRDRNCFLHIDDFQAAQRLMNKQLRAAWPSLLKGIVGLIHPAHREIFPRGTLHPRMEYYWSVYESEWATDVAFARRSDLERLYPPLIRHGMTTFSSGDVMRFLGRKVTLEGRPRASFTGQIISDTKQRQEGVRIKHRAGSNWLKMYDKGNNLRFEMTMNNPQDFKVFRPKEGDPKGCNAWRPLRKGIADLRRRAEVSQAANERLMEAQAMVDDDTPLGKLAETLCRPVRVTGRRKPDGSRSASRRHRALNPFSSDDFKLLAAISRGEFHENGFRNRDLRHLLYSQPARLPKEQRRRAACVSRKLALLRAHGLIRKVPKTHRYTVTTNGRLAITALLAAHNASTNLLTQAAA